MLSVHNNIFNIILNFMYFISKYFHEPNNTYTFIKVLQCMKYFHILLDKSYFVYIYLLRVSFVQLLFCFMKFVETTRPRSNSCGYTLMSRPFSSMFFFPPSLLYFTKLLQFICHIFCYATNTPLISVFCLS